MKNILVIIGICITTLVCCITIHADSATTTNQESTEQEDSTLSVIGWFYKNDSVIYEIKQCDWRIKGTDTTRTTGIIMDSQFVVTDSTSTGYKIKYTILDIDCDTLLKSPLSSLLSKINLRISKKLIGTTIEFETNECGKITKFNNLNRIKRQTQSLLKIALDEIKQMPEAQFAKKKGVDIENIFNNISSDQLIDDYLREINMIFQCHGLMYNIGEFEEYEEANDSTYEHYDRREVYTDPDDSYHLLFYTESVIPNSDLEYVAGDLVNTLKSNAVSEMYLNTPVHVIDGKYTEFTQLDYLPYGWPYYIVNQRSTAVSDIKKVRQITFSLKSYK